MKISAQKLKKKKSLKTEIISSKFFTTHARMISKSFKIP